MTSDVVARVRQHFLADEQRLGLDHRHAIRQQVESVAPLLSAPEVSTIASQVHAQLFGLGALEPLLADADITELMINGPGNVWIERHGELARADVTIDEDGLRVLIDRIVGPLGLRVDRTAPVVDARLADGSRVNIAVAPLALDGPYVTIRRFRPEPFTLEAFCAADIAELLRGAMFARQSLMVSGGTGSGKTSLVNALAAELPAHERIITIEDAAELRLPGEHVVRLESRPPNAEGVGEVTIRSLVRNALRMRPDRIVIGEVRGAEAFDLIQAMNTGHDGCLSTCHANSPVDALRRLEAMALMADVQVPVDVLRDHVASAIGLIVHMVRGSDGRRLVDAVYRCDTERWLVRDGERAN